jgi:hypothetical protein
MSPILPLSLLQAFPLLRFHIGQETLLVRPVPLPRLTLAAPQGMPISVREHRTFGLRSTGTNNLLDD